MGIVNAKGRLFDPKLGRFLQVDPLQTDLFNAQRWNSYSYALNNPLRYIDPSGFDGEEAASADLPSVSIGPRWDAHGQLDPSYMVEWHCSADRYSTCVGTTVPIKAAGGERGTAQAGSAAEEASAPPAAGAVDVALADPRVSGTPASPRLPRGAPAPPRPVPAVEVAPSSSQPPPRESPPPHIPRPRAPFVAPVARG